MPPVACAEASDEERHQLRTYKYFEVERYGRGQLLLRCTDPAELDWILTQLSQFSSYQIYRKEEDLSEVGMCFCHLEEIRDQKNRETMSSAYMWVARELCVHGWEPLGNGQFRTFSGD